jgi:hypothetical protein
VRRSQWENRAWLLQGSYGVFVHAAANQALKVIINVGD